jgi:hypothetical protein
MIKAIDGTRDGGVEFLDGAEGLMREEVAFEIAPGAFDVVQFRCVFGQPLDGQPGALSAVRVSSLIGMGPLSSTRITGLAAHPGFGP